MDVKTAFLNGELEEEIYMQQPEGFIEKGKEKLVCRLRKSLYGLKQAGRAGYEKIHAALIQLGFDFLRVDHCIYRLVHGSAVVIIAVYVDDLTLFSNCITRLAGIKQELSQLFEMKDLGEAQFLLGVQIVRDRAARTLTISQGEYVKNVVDRLGLNFCNPTASPLDNGTRLSKRDCPPPDKQNETVTRQYQAAVGAITYAMIATRPDIAYAVTALSQFNSNPGPAHWKALKRLGRYLRGTINYSITYRAVPGKSLPSVLGYCDSDWGADVDDRRSISGWAFLLCGAAISWQAKKQPTVALSSVEAEYMASTQATKEAMWLRTFLSSIGQLTEGPTIIRCDSQGSIDMGKNPEYHARSKHIDIQHHFVREQVAAKTVQFVHVSSEAMAADVLTKPLPRPRHQQTITLLGVGAV
jgi:hypothetical protein